MEYILSSWMDIRLDYIYFIYTNYVLFSASTARTLNRTPQLPPHVYSRTLHPLKGKHMFVVYKVVEVGGALQSSVRCPSPAHDHRN